MMGGRDQTPVAAWRGSSDRVDGNWSNPSEKIQAILGMVFPVSISRIHTAYIGEDS